MTKNETLHIRVNSEVKENAEKILILIPNRSIDKADR